MKRYYCCDCKNWQGNKMYTAYAKCSIFKTVKHWADKCPYFEIKIVKIPIIKR